MKTVNLISAVCENNGIGIKGTLPWKLKKEMQYFTKLTTYTEASDCQNAVVMGRKSWESIPPKYKPLSGRLNVVISTTQNNFTDGVLSYKSVSEAIETLQAGFPNIETIWVIGGYGVYKEGLDKKLFDKLYITTIRKQFECDAFFPQFNLDDYQMIEEPDIPTVIQEENGIQYEYKVYKKK